MEGCTGCRDSAWCLAKTWPEEKKGEQFEIDSTRTNTMVVVCGTCGRFWRVGLSEDFSKLMMVHFEEWEVRPCKRGGGGWGWVDTCMACGGVADVARLPLENGMILDIKVKGRW